MAWKGIRVTGVLFLDNTLMTFNQLKKTIEVDLFRIMPMEILTAVVRGYSTMFEQMLGPVMEHLPTSLQEIVFKERFVIE